MLKAGTKTGSLINHLYSNVANGPTPTIGLGVTILGWTDRHAGTILATTAKTITVQRDIAVRVDKNGMSESQEYAYSPNPNGIVEVFRLTKRGWRNKSGNGLLIGARKQYYDY